MKKIFRAKICVPAPLAHPSLHKTKGPARKPISGEPPPPPPPSPGAHAIPPPPPQSNFRAAPGGGGGWTRWGGSFSHLFGFAMATRTIEGSQKPMRNKETTRSTRGESQNGKLHCTLCAVWLSKKGAVLEDHVLGENMKQLDGSYAGKPGSHARKAAAQPVPKQAPEAAPQQLPTVNIPF